MYVSHYFRPEEFEACVPSCSYSDMSEDLLRRLDIARHYLSEPIILNSAYRSEDYEKSKGRSGTSSHCKGCAVDIYCVQPSHRLKLVRALLVSGFFRIGIAENFVHADIDVSKPACIWLY